MYLTGAMPSMSDTLNKHALCKTGAMHKKCATLVKIDLRIQVYRPFYIRQLLWRPTCEQYLFYRKRGRINS